MTYIYTALVQLWVKDKQNLKLWNQSPAEVNQIQSLNIFERQLELFLLNNC